MSQHFLREIDTLKKKILTVGAVVEERIAQAITAVVKHDAALAQQVAEGDDEIDEISVPFGLAPAEQIVRPECTNSQSSVMRHARDLRSIFRGFVLSELVQTVSK